MNRHVFVTTLICSLMLTAPASSDPKLFGNAVTMGIVADIKLTQEQQRTLKWYRSNKAYFGAFYVAPQTEHHFWTRNFHSLKNAKQAAKAGCEITSKGIPCILYAVQYPKGIDPNAPVAVGLGQETARDFLRKYPKRHKDGKYGAFAINGGADYGYSSGWDNAAEAKETALAYCAASSAKTMAALGIQGRKWVTSKGLDKCQVVDVHVPPQN